MRSFPDVSLEFKRESKAALDRYELRPSAFGHYADPSRVTGRDLTPDEELGYSRIQIEAAYTLGFPLARLGYFDPDAAIRGDALYWRLLPDAERVGVRLAMEVHCPFIVESAEQQRVIEAVLRLDSPFVGFTVDCGIMASRVSQVCLEKFLDIGVRPEVVDRLSRCGMARVSLPQLRAEVQAMGGDPLAELLAHETQVYFDHGEPGALRQIMPFVYHVHGKFFDMDDTGIAPAVRYSDVIAVLQESGYDGFITSEYEGHHWVSDRDAFSQVRRHQQMLRGLLTRADTRRKSETT